MSFEEEFDSIMRRKSEEMDYPFDEKNWDKASAMLDAERNAAGPRRRFLLPLLLAGGLLITGAALLVTGPAAGQSQAVKTAPTEQQAADQTAHKTAAAPVQQQEESSKILASLPVQTSAAIEHNTQAQQASLAETTPVHAPATLPEKVSSAPAKDTRTVGHTFASPVATTMRTQATEAATGKSETRNAQSSASNAGAMAANAGKAEQGMNAAFTRDKGTADEVPALGEKNKDQNNNSTAENGSEAQQATPAEIASELSFVALPLAPVAGLPEAEQEVSNTFNYLNWYDDDYYKSNKRTKTHFLNVELGGTYLLGWNTQAGKDGKGLDWFGGVNYGLYFTRKISMSLGIQAYDIKNITQAFYTNKKIEYDFGSITSNTVITSNSLYYVAVPVKFNYALNRGNQFSLGTNIGYLVDSQNKIETYQVQDGQMTHYKPVKNTGVYQAANSWNIMFSVSYRAELIPRLYMNTELVYGMSDIFKNTNTNQNKEQAMGLRLSLQYTLFDK